MQPPICCWLHLYPDRCVWENGAKWTHLQRSQTCTLESFIRDSTCWSRAWGVFSLANPSVRSFLLGFKLLCSFSKWYIYLVTRQIEVVVMTNDWSQVLRAWGNVIQGMAKTILFLIGWMDSKLQVSICSKLSHNSDVELAKAQYGKTGFDQ